MKSKFSKLSKLLTMILVMLLGLSSTMTNVNAAAKSITLGNAESIPKLIGQTYFAMMKTTSGQYVYCLDINKQTVANQTLTLVGEKDAGFAYLMQNGYPAKNITGNRVWDIYITQTAVWWYLDSTAGTSNLSNNFKSTASDPNGLRPYIANLVNEAMKAKNKGYAKTSISINNSNKNMTLSADKKYYVSKAISVKSSNIDNYEVSVSNAPSGTIITTESGKQKNTFSSNSKFLVKVPVNKVTSTSVSFTVNVKAKGTVYKAYEYKPSDTNRYQNVVTSVLSPVTTNVSDSTKLNIETSKLTIVKINKSTGKALAGAKLVLKDSTGAIVSSWTSTTKAHVIQNLTNGTYKLEETAAPDGFEKLEKPITIKITSSNKDQSIVVYNEKAESEISIIKVNKTTGQPLAGAKLILKNSKGKTVASWTSTTSAYVIKDLEDGTYTVEETAAPKGFKKLEKPITIKITSSNRKQTINVSNEEESEISIIKINKTTGKSLAGAKLVLKNSKGKTVASWTSTTSAYVIKGLEDGTYTLEETAAPKGFKKLEKPITIKITSSNRKQTINVSNEEDKGEVSIIKIDKTTGKALAGAKLVLKDSTGKTVASWTSTIKEYVIKDLENGTYTLEEIEPPKGYKKLDKTITIKIDDNNKKQTIKVSNEPKTTVVNIIKIDASTGNILTDAELVVKDSKGKEIARFKTTNEPYVLTNLEDGTYTVEEVSAPNGYKLSTEVKKFTIDDEHLSHQITFENYPETISIPDTSSAASIIMYILGIAFIGGAAGFVYKNGKAK